MRAQVLRLLLLLISTSGVSVADTPKALILGDSISIGYTPMVTEMLHGTVTVSRPRANCGSTEAGIKSLDKWLGEKNWQVIHFNWGLHDLCYRHPQSKVQGNRDKVNGTQAVAPEVYRKNLEQLVVMLKKTNAKLIFATTTVVPPGEAGRHVGDDRKYNEIALQVMAQHDIQVNDLHHTSAAFSEDMFVGPGNVHFTKAGSRKLAEQVAEAIKLAATEE